MDEKNLEALSLGREWMLAKLANLFEPCARQPNVDAAITKTVEEFKAAYGELEPGFSVKEYVIYAKVFQHAWHAKTSRDKQYISQHITAILERVNADEVDEVWGVLPRPRDGAGASGPRPVLPFHVPRAYGPDDPRLRPGIVAEFESGEVTVKPRTLLDWLAKSLLECRDRLAICERKGCEHPYFVRRHARQRFCSADCANSIRQQKKGQWWAENREQFIKKWRAERKARKRALRRRR